MATKRLITPIKVYLFNGRAVTQQEFFRELWSVSTGVITHEEWRRREELLDQGQRVDFGWNSFQIVYEEQEGESK